MTGRPSWELSAGAMEEQPAQSASASFRGEFFEHLKQTWTHAAQLNPTAGEILECTAEAAVAAGIVVGAIALSRGHGGFLLSESERIDRAIEKQIVASTRQLEQADPTASAAILKSRARSYAQLGDSSSALGDLNKSIEQSGGDSESFRLRSQINSRLGDFAAADSDYMRFAHELGKESVMRVYPGTSAHNAASLVEAMDLVPPSITAAKQVRELDGLQARIIGATQVIERETSHISDRALNYKARGVWYAELGHDGRAMQDLDRSIALDSTQSDTFLKRSQLHVRLGDSAAAEADQNQARLLKEQQRDDAPKKATADSGWYTDRADYAKSQAALRKRLAGSDFAQPSIAETAAQSVLAQISQW